MNDERSTLVDRLLGAALEKPSDERATFLREACGGDEALRLDVESLITHAASGVGVVSTAALGSGLPHGGTVFVGRQIGSYTIQAPLGVGGMGEVYRARDGTLGRDVAIKILPRAFSTDPDRRSRFDREARLLAALNHPQIGAIYGVEDSGGVRALVLELIEGDTLAERIAKGPIPLTETLRIARQIADALDAAHEKGIVHRDLKPANIKITPEGIVKVLDFGLAKAAAGDTSGPDLTQSPTVTIGGTHDGVILGTAPYMSPEQARGKAIDKRTDVWAFGCVVYEMLTGRVAFAGETLSDTIAAILEREPEWSALPAATPAPIRRLIFRCLDKDARRRLRDIGDVRTELDDVLSGATTLAPTPAASPFVRRPRWLIHALWAATLVAGLALVWSVGRPAGDAALPPNPQPIIVLMDSPLPGRVYDPRTEADGGTNADDVTDALRSLPVAIRKENTSAVWHREEQVLRQNPDLIIAHLSSFMDERFANGDSTVEDHLADQAENRLLLFFAYVASRNARTRFLPYSREQFKRKGGESKWVANEEPRLSILKGRLHAFTVPGGRAGATFREPTTAQLLRTRVMQVLGLPGP